MARGGVEGPILDLGIWEFGNLGIWDLGSSETLGFPSALGRWGGGGPIPKFPNSQIPKFPNSQIPKFPNPGLGPRGDGVGGGRPIPKFPNSQIPKSRNLGIWEFGNLGFGVVGDPRSPFGAWAMGGGQFPNSQIPKFPNSQIPKFPNSQIQDWAFEGGVEGPILDLGIWEFGNLGIWDTGGSRFAKYHRKVHADPGSR